MMQINLTGFLNGRNAREFMGELWGLMNSAQVTKDGIPPELIELKKLEITQRQETPAPVVDSDPRNGAARVSAQLIQQAKDEQAERKLNKAKRMTSRSPKKSRSRSPRRASRSRSPRRSRSRSPDNRSRGSFSRNHRQRRRSPTPPRRPRSPVSSDRWRRRPRNRRSSSGSDREAGKVQPKKTELSQKQVYLSSS